MASASRALRLASTSAPLRGGGGGAVSSRPLRPLAAAVGSLLPAAAQRPPGSSRRSPPRPRCGTRRRTGGGPPNESNLLDEGCDFEHWTVVMAPPPGDPKNPDVTRDSIIDSYVKTLTKVVGRYSRRSKAKDIFSVNRHYFAFGALLSEEVSNKIKELPNVRWVLPDSYMDVKNKAHGGEPFINGQAVPYDPKYHEEWVRNNERTGGCRCHLRMATKGLPKASVD
ncbi:hypothetical protein PVAP13_2KG203296 [Panicum virgatum]|uniref:MORF/ORRM1/DAG-like MORF domain-containing protein n=1 Tax=Panicum virgatum TaxID=38727 RepID=A0A8T0WGV5_PANVG|nr:hypothetical protein PVAP13_2KG203296 [Panicum virgatum]